MNWKRIAREPLVHFLALGAALFILFDLTGSGAPGRSDIVVTQAQLNQMIEIWSRTWQRLPTQKELDGLVEDYVKEEIFAREAKAMGLDKDDTIIRRRLRQKMEFLSQDLAGQVEPTEEELTRFLNEQQERFFIPPKYSFRQLYFSPDRRGDRCEQDARDVAEALNTRESDHPELLGDPWPLSFEYEQVSENEVDRLFGGDFASHLSELPLGVWSDPVVSGYGLHLVFVREYAEGRLPSLEEIRDDVEREWSVAKREEANQLFYERLREKYDVSVEMQDGEGAPG